MLDFGIAKVPVGALAQSSTTSDHHQVLTQLGVVYGTPEYMAPEQALGQARRPAGRPVCARRDVLRDADRRAAVQLGEQGRAARHARDGGRAAHERTRAGGDGAAGGRGHRAAAARKRSERAVPRRQRADRRDQRRAGHVRVAGARRDALRDSGALDAGALDEGARRRAAVGRFVLVGADVAGADPELGGREARAAGGPGEAPRAALRAARRGAARGDDRAPDEPRADERGRQRVDQRVGDDERAAASADRDRGRTGRRAGGPGAAAGRRAQLRRSDPASSVLEEKEQKNATVRYLLERSLAESGRRKEAMAEALGAPEARPRPGRPDHALELDVRNAALDAGRPRRTASGCSRGPWGPRGAVLLYDIGYRVEGFSAAAGSSAARARESRTCGRTRARPSRSRSTCARRCSVAGRAR